MTAVVTKEPKKAEKQGIYIDSQIRSNIEGRIRRGVLSQENIRQITVALRDGNEADGTNATYLFKLAIMEYRKSIRVAYSSLDYKETGIMLSETLLETIVTPNDRVKNLVMEGVVVPILEEGNDYHKEVVYSVLSFAEQQLLSRLKDVGRLIRSPLP